MKIEFCNERRLPIIIEADEKERRGEGREALFRLCLDHRDFLQEKLLEHGALLLRGFPVLTAPEFAQVVRWFSGRELLDYVGGASPRMKLGGGVYTSTEYPKYISLSLHNELSYTYTWPVHLFFHCVRAARRGGETPLGDSRELLKKIDADVLSEFRRKHVRYERNLSGDPGSDFSWQAAFETTERAAVEAYCRAGRVEFRWKDDGGLWLGEVRPATAVHWGTGQEVWFNQADGFHPSALTAEDYSALLATMKEEEEFRLNSYFGDRTPLDPSALEHIREVVREEMVLVPWREGDVMIIDNMLVAHGRMPFEGPRRVLLAMT